MFSSEAWLAKTDSGFYNGVATQSARFNSGSSSYLYFTPSSNGDRRKATLSFWFKKTTNGETYPTMFCCNNSSSGHFMTITFYEDSLYFQTAPSADGLITTAKYMDTTAWYHCCWSIDTTQSTASDRVKCYINGSQITSFSTEQYPDQDSYLDICSTVQQAWGYFPGYGRYFNGYIADAYIIDGQQLTPSSFTETKNGALIPKKYTGSYGTNGVHLEFKQTGTGTASTSTIGADTSGNTHHYTSSGMGSDDSNLPDCPEVNFCTWNSLFRGGEQSSSITASSTLSEGNLQVSVPTNSYMGNTFRPTSGKWYCEIYLKTRGSVNGEIDYGWLQATTYSGATAHGGVANKWGAYYHGYAAARYVLYDEASQLGSDITYEIAQGDVLQLAWDIDNAKGWIGVNNTWYRTDASDGNPSAGSNEAFSWTADEAQNLQVYVANGTSTDVFVANFGQDSTFAGSISASGNTDAKGYPFKYTPPTNFLALCSANLSEPTISPNADTQATDYFTTYLHTGDGVDGRSLTGMGFQPDLHIIKNRSNSGNDTIVTDSVRGETQLAMTGNYQDNPATNKIESLDADGFTVGQSVHSSVNASSQTYVSWNWKAGGHHADVSGNFIKDGVAFTPTQGTIDATYISVNTTSCFSIVQFTSDISSDVGETGTPPTIAHGIGVKPSFVIIKDRDGGSYPHWNVWHQGYQPDATYLNYQLFLETNAASNNAGWHRTDTGFTTNLFTPPRYQYNETGKTYICYVFAEVEGYSSFGGYKGNSNADGTYVHTGFSPSWVMVKKASAAENWVIFDNTRDTFNLRDSYLLANTTAAETVYSGVQMDFLSNGFKLRGDQQLVNDSSHSFIYIAFAEQPFKYSNAR